MTGLPVVSGSGTTDYGTNHQSIPVFSAPGKPVQDAIDKLAQISDNVKNNKIKYDLIGANSNSYAHQLVQDAFQLPVRPTPPEGCTAPQSGTTINTKPPKK